mmetsp:Transcript_11428/g.19312  ORF Transcript_11428/g.19312 Transcript_11428/m.19312 type:complete len:111 (-) Transcript_11428:224-556(-)
MPECEETVPAEVLLQIQTGGAAHQQIQASTWIRPSSQEHLHPVPSGPEIVDGMPEDDGGLRAMPEFQVPAPEALPSSEEASPVENSEGSAKLVGHETSIKIDFDSWTHEC